MQYKCQAAMRKNYAQKLKLLTIINMEIEKGEHNMNKQAKRISKSLAALTGLVLMGAAMTSNAQSTPVTTTQNTQVAYWYGGWGYGYGPYWGVWRPRPIYYNYYGPVCKKRCFYNWRGDVVRCRRACWR